MKRLLVFILFFIFQLGYTQVLSGRVLLRDASLIVLNRVYITNLTTQTTTISNYNGEFSIPANPNDKIRFTSIVTERKDIIIGEEQLKNPIMVELIIQQYAIPEVIVGRFKPTGNLRRDVNALKFNDKNEKLQKMIGLPTPKPGGNTNNIMDLNNGAIGINLDGLFDIISGEGKKKKRLAAYMQMDEASKRTKDYLGPDYFRKIKIPERFIDDFLHFAYTSENYYYLVQRGNFEEVKVRIEKYLPTFLKRLENSKLLEVATS